MNVSIQNNYIGSLNHMFYNLSLNKDSIDETQREKFINRALSLKEMGMDITETSKITSSFLKEFYNVSISSEFPTHEERIAALSGRYIEMRDELSNMFKDNEEEYYNQVERLNTAFKSALDSTCLTPLYAPKTIGIKAISYTKEEEIKRIRFEEDSSKESFECEQYNKNVENVRQNFRDNLLRHVDVFYEGFINSAKNNNFNKALQESMSLIKSGSTESYTKIAYSDMVYIMDVINNIPIDYDENKLPINMRYNTAEQSFIELIKDNKIPYSVQKELSNLFGFNLI